MRSPALVGGVSTPTIIECPKCGESVIIPVGLTLRIPDKPTGDYCHETWDMKAGRSYVKGGHR